MANVGVMAGVAVFVGVSVSLGMISVDVGGIDVSVGVSVDETGAGLNVEVGSGVATGAQEEIVNSAIMLSVKKIHLNFIVFFR